MPTRWLKMPAMPRPENLQNGQMPMFAHARKNLQNIGRARKFPNGQIPDVPANFEMGKCSFAHVHH